MQSKLCCNLLEIIEKQDNLIKKQNEILAELTNANAEKENMINVLMNEFSDT